MAGTLACRVGERVGRVGYDEQHGVGRGVYIAGKDLVIDRRVPVEQPQPAQRVVPVGRAARFLVNAKRDHHQRAACEIGVVAVNNRELGREGVP